MGFTQTNIKSSKLQNFSTFFSMNRNLFFIQFIPFLVSFTIASPINIAKEQLTAHDLDTDTSDVEYSIAEAIDAINTVLSRPAIKNLAELHDTEADTDFTVIFDREELTEMINHIVSKGKIAELPASVNPSDAADDSNNGVFDYDQELQRLVNNNMGLDNPSDREE